MTSPRKWSRPPGESWLPAGQSALPRTSWRMNHWSLSLGHHRWTSGSGTRWCIRLEQNRNGTWRGFGTAHLQETARPSKPCLTICRTILELLTHDSGWRGSDTEKLRQTPYGNRGVEKMPLRGDSRILRCSLRSRSHLLSSWFSSGSIAGVSSGDPPRHAAIVLDRSGNGILTRILGLDTSVMLVL